MSTFRILNFTIPNELKSLYEEISAEFEKVVCDSVKSEPVLETKQTTITFEKGSYETF